MPHFKTSDGLGLYFEDTGIGQPLLCLAGLTRNHRDFSFLAPHMQRHRMIALDYRGRGESDFDSDHANYNVMREAQDVVELLDHLGLEKVVILGTSRGGLIAMMLAATARDRLAGVVLNDIGPEIPAGGIARIMDYVGRKPAARTLGEAARGMMEALGPQFPDLDLVHWRLVAGFQYRQNRGALELRYDPALRTALLEQAEAGPTPDLWPLFEALQGLPVGVLRGANSDLFAPETLAEMQRRMPALIAAEVPNRGHVPLLNEPESLQVIAQVMEAAK